MNRNYFIFIVFLLFNLSSFGQRFKVPYDSIYSSIYKSETIHNDISNLSNDTIKVKWRILSHDFPTSWSDNVGICDNLSCYTNNNNSLFNGTVYTTARIFPKGFCNFYLLLDFLSVPSGTHFVTLHLTDDSTVITPTWIVQRNVTGLLKIEEVNSTISIYPNPGSNFITVLDKLEKAEYLEIRDISGKLLITQEINTMSTRIDVSYLVKGLYISTFFDRSGVAFISKKLVIE